MNPFLLKPLLALLFAMAAPIVPVHEGSSPQLAVDSRGTVRMIFGRQDTIFAVTSTDQGKSFGVALVVGVVPDMHLGNTRGPVIASSKSRTLVAAVDKTGNIHLFQLEHAAGLWRPLPRPLNDKPGSAPEGLITLAADDADGFYAAWLDVRADKHNQIFFSRTTATTPGAPWSPNMRINTAAIGSACECCRPSVAVAGGTVAVMFRNTLSGSRDMFLASSADGGRTFADAHKLGTGSWKIDACPMDGGALNIGTRGQVSTVWRRENTVYYARPGEAESVIGPGRSPMMSSGPSGSYIIWQDAGRIRLRALAGKDDMIVGDGNLPQVLALADGHPLTAWEKNGEVFVRKVD